MNLVAKFRLTTSVTTVPIGSLEVDRPYNIVRAERVKSQYGPSVALTQEETERSRVKVFLPKRYAGLFVDSEIEAITAGRISLTLFYTLEVPPNNSVQS
jgi:hypothetical protein